MKRARSAVVNIVLSGAGIPSSGLNALLGVLIRCECIMAEKLFIIYKNSLLILEL
ncbi:histone acetyltransferase HAC1-like isoform X4 [Acetobacter orientalis]|uniref:Histone acetyltransferase HAC1-like isoform X4 n=1 Tax=Acetobacter orientalis TaxID=146474 RepID=A0A2Z5ZH68_9PROT|nr:histone acetyltransferase HAC1-like isoform X4 [Acetobacter orientalis]